MNGAFRRALAALGTLPCLVLAAPVSAQFAHEPTAAVSDVPAGPAAIRGRIIHATRPDAAEGIAIVLYALTSTGETGLRSAETDANGDFAFENLSNDPKTVYLVGARYGEIPFGTKVSFAANELLRSIELAVSEPSADAVDATQVRTGESELYFDRSCEQLRVREAIEIRNPTNRVILIPEELRDEREPLLELALPEGASGFRSALGDVLSGLIEAGGTVRFWGPLHPGTQEIEFSYALPDSGEPVRVRRTLGRGADAVVVIVPSTWPAPRGAVPVGAPTEASEVTRYPIVRDAVPGSVLRFELTAPARSVESTQGAVSLVESQIWMELDDAAMTINEHHLLEWNGNEAGAPRASGEPLLCISLPEDAKSLHFSNQTLALGISLDPSGALAVHGPSPTGSSESSVSFRYRLTVRSEPIEFERTFTQRVPLLSVLIADTHLLTETDRLHRRRATRSGERTYIHLEAFEVGAGETVSLRLTRLAVAAPLPRWATGGLLAAATAGAVVFLAAPLRTRRSDEDEDFGEEELASAAERAAAERENIYAAIDDLDHDLETGKLTAEDHATMRSDLLAKAMALVQTERAAQAAVDPMDQSAVDKSAMDEGATVAGVCSSCSAPLAEDARFCSHCGVPVHRASGTG